MTAEKMALTANIHRPRVERAARLSGSDAVSVVLGNEHEYAQNVALIFGSDSAAISFAQSIIAEVYGLDDETEKCPACPYVGIDADDLAEHVFGNHPGEVAK
jgi:hypothetical protein